MAIIQEDRPRVEEVETQQSTTSNPVILDPEELVAQEFGLDKDTVNRVWKILEADVRREVEAAVRSKYFPWALLAIGLSVILTPLWLLASTSGLLLTFAFLPLGPWLWARRFQYDVPWPAKVAHVSEVHKALGSPSPGKVFPLRVHPPLLQEIMEVAHRPARIELARQGLAMNINERTGSCGKDVRRQMAQDLVQAFVCTPRLGNTTISI